jgi:proteasome lid subunit RPN8/RPN11
VQEPPDDLAVELEPAEEPELRVRPRPSNARHVVQQVGDGVAREPEVYLHVDALTTVLAHAQHHGRTEAGGLLAGEVCRDDAGVYVTATGAVPAEDALRTSTSLTFTHAAWAAMLVERDHRFPGSRVVGWFHTHPGLHVYLSRPDQFIHQSLFRNPNDIAVVVDHRRLEWGVFRWHGDCLEVAQRFFVYTERRSDGQDLLGVLAGLVARRPEAHDRPEHDA